MKLNEMNDIDKVGLMNRQNFGNDLADIQIQLQFNPEIWIRILHHFQLKLNTLVEVCALQAQSSLKSGKFIVCSK